MMGILEKALTIPDRLMYWWDQRQALKEVRSWKLADWSPEAEAIMVMGVIRNRQQKRSGRLMSWIRSLSRRS